MVLNFRPLARDDFPLLCRWLAEPHVLLWWEQDPSPEAVEAKYGPSLDGQDPTEHFVVECDGDDVGFIQRYRIARYPEWVEALKVAGTPPDAAGCDYLIGSADLIGRGLGPQVIGTFVAEMWDRYPEVPAVVIDVDARNQRSWRALEKVGFERVYTGMIEDDEPGLVDTGRPDGPAHVYLLPRPERRAEPASGSG